VPISALRSPGQARQNRFHALHVDRLHEVIGRAHFQGVDGGFHRGVAGNHNHLDPRARIEVLEQVDPAAVRQFQVGKYDIRHLPDQLDTRFAQIARGGGSEAVFPNNGGKRLASSGVVINNQYVWHRVSKAPKVWSWMACGTDLQQYDDLWRSNSVDCCKDTHYKTLLGQTVIFLASWRAILRPLLVASRR
jgi:hypothetical protein